MRPLKLRAVAEMHTSFSARMPAPLTRYARGRATTGHRASANRLAATASETSRQTPLVWVTSPRSFFTTLTVSSIQR